MSDTPYRLQCLEVWGGNEPARQAVSLAGLDAWVEAIPHAHSAAGGDVHYLSSCATGRITRLFLADVSGHGGQVAEIGRSLRVLMREHVNHHEQTSFVRAMNRSFVKQAKSGIFATALVCTFYAPRNELSICNAGHPPPLLFRAATRRWEIIDDRKEERPCDDAIANIPLGILDLADYGQFRIRLDPGDRVLLYTDSLIESRTPDGELLGSAGLLQIANGIDADVRSDAFIETLHAALVSHVGDSLLDDDVTMVLITPNAATRRIGFWKRAYAPIRVLADVIVRRSDGTRRFGKA